MKRNSQITFVVSDQIIQFTVSNRNIRPWRCWQSWRIFNIFANCQPLVWVETQAYTLRLNRHTWGICSSRYAITNKRTDRKRYQIFAKKGNGASHARDRGKGKKTVISVVGKREWDPSLRRWLFWEWTETWILVHGRETSFALWEVERWRREVDLINPQPAAVYYCLDQLLFDILLGVLKMLNTSQVAFFLKQKAKCLIFS